MKNYIVSIYRNEENNPQAIVGVVEDVGGEVKKAFRSFEELRDILSAAGNTDKGLKMLNKER